MVQVILKKTSDTSNSVTIHGNLIYGTEYIINKLHQSSLKTADGDIKTYNSGNIVEVKGVLKLKGVKKSEGENLRDWISNALNFNYYKFNIIGIPGVDLGEGDGSDILGCNLNKKDDGGLFDFRPPGIYAIELPYRFKKEIV